MAKHASKAPQSDSSPRKGADHAGEMAGMNPAMSSMAEQMLENDAARAAKRKRGLKIFGIAMGVIVAVLLAAYLIGAFVFSGRFFPNTRIADIDISLKTPDEVHALLDEKVGGYTFEVSGQGLDVELTGQDVGISLDAAAISSDIMSRNNIWAWPYEAFRDHDETASLADALGSTGLTEALTPAVEAVNAAATAPVNATIGFDEKTGAFAVVPEQYGTQLDLEKVVNAVSEGVVRLDAKISLGEDVLALPAILKDDERLAAAVDTANAMVATDLDLMIGGNPVTEVTPALVATWITLDADLNVTINEETFGPWIDEVAAGCNTVGSQRTYTRPDGKTVTVAGGTYGWEIDSAALRTAVSDAVHAGTVGTLDIPVLQSGNGFSGLGSKDWGARYCDVDLSEQHARFYDGSGALVWESDIVSGKPGHDTPTGVYSLNSKQSPSTLIGQTDPETGEPEYETKVQYWMPFVGNSVGLHDATWQAAFGGSRWEQGYGSHGCVNLPLGKAEAIYGIIQVGDVVVVHW